MLSIERIAGQPGYSGGYLMFRYEVVWPTVGRALHPLVAIACECVQAAYLENAPLAGVRQAAGPAAGVLESDDDCGALSIAAEDMRAEMTDVIVIDGGQ